MQTMATDNSGFTGKISGNVLVVLITHGLDRTLEHLCMISVFSVLSVE